MPRPLSWLPRLHEITKTVTNLVRSHYARQDFERLFKLQPRAAQKLLDLLPMVVVGTSRLVEHEVLADFLERVRDGDDTAALFETLRQEKAAAPHRKVRSLVRRDLDPISLSSLLYGITLTRGRRLEVSFGTVEQLAESLLWLARVLESNGDGFAEAYEVRKESVTNDDAADEVRRMFAELEELEGVQRNVC